jgi:hypothetical protein
MAKRPGSAGASSSDAVAGAEPTPDVAPAPTASPVDLPIADPVDRRAEDAVVGVEAASKGQDGDVAIGGVDELSKERISVEALSTGLGEAAAAKAPRPRKQQRKSTQGLPEGWVVDDEGFVVPGPS